MGACGTPKFGRFRQVQGVLSRNLKDVWQIKRLSAHELSKDLVQLAQQGSSCAVQRPRFREIPG